MQQLDDLGFTWQVIKSAENRAPSKSWDERFAGEIQINALPFLFFVVDSSHIAHVFQDLLRYKEEHGHTVVPQQYPGLGG